MNNCRGQSDDNAANMAGIYTGLQARKLQVSPLTHFCTLCSTLTESGWNMQCRELPICCFLLCSVCITFCLHQPIDGTNSKIHLIPSHGLVKNPSGTRWSARAEATRAVVSHYKEIRAALCTNQDQS